MDSFKENRDFMKSGFDIPEREFISDQERGMTPPPVAKTVDSSLKIIELPEVNKNLIKQSDIYTCIGNRRSRRNYKDTPITLEELSFLLWLLKVCRR